MQRGANLPQWIERSEQKFKWVSHEEGNMEKSLQIGTPDRYQLTVNSYATRRTGSTGRLLFLNCEGVTYLFYHLDTINSEASNQFEAAMHFCEKCWNEPTLRLIYTLVLSPKFLRQETRHKSVQSCGIPNDRQTGNVSTGKRSLKNRASLGTDWNPKQDDWLMILAETKTKFEPFKQMKYQRLFPDIW